jgi:group I intron endonuclease
LQRAFIRDGEAAFKFEILLTCSKEECKTEEQKALDLHKSYDPEVGYNICKAAGSTLGRKHSEETRKKIGANRVYGEPANKGKKASLESRQKMSISQKNSPASKAHRDELAKQKRLKNS